MDQEDVAKGKLRCTQCSREFRYGDSSKMDWSLAYCGGLGYGDCNNKVGLVCSDHLDYKAGYSLGSCLECIHDHTEYQRSQGITYSDSASSGEYEEENGWHGECGECGYEWDECVCEPY